MDTNPSTFTQQPVYAPPPGIFGSKIPSSVAFAFAVVLFFLPFINIKCGGMSIQQVTGFQLATGFQTKNSSSDSPFLNDFKTDQVDQTITKATTKSDKKDPNLFAMVALGLGVLGLLVSLLNSKATLGVSMVAALGAVGCLIALFVDIKQKIKLEMPSTGGGGGSGGDTGVMGDFGDKLNDIGKAITVDFAPWFFICVAAFLAAAFFCLKRMKYAK